MQEIKETEEPKIVYYTGGEKKKELYLMQLSQFRWESL